MPGFGMVEMGHRRRPYIDNLRNDPRTRALMDSWVSQATMAVEARHGRPESERDARRQAHEIAQEAVALAMSFVLDNDGEYQMVCEERDRILKSAMDLRFLTPEPHVVTATVPAN